VGKKILLFFLFGLCAWNLAKIPYILAFDIDAADEFSRRGLEGSITLAKWVEGYRGTKLKSPSINFLAVHNVIGITVLMMMAISLLSHGFRRKYGVLFFAFGILLGIHTIPAALLMDSAVKRFLFTGTCIEVILASIFGLVVLHNYERWEPRSARYLLIAFGLVTFGAYGAGFAESFQIVLNVLAKVRTSVWPQYGDLPDPMYGNTIYDRVPEIVGLTFVVLWIAIVWVGLPAKRYFANHSSTAS